MLKFLNEGQFDERVNTTHIVFTPRVESPIGLSDFIPISLCNILYKIIVKTLINRLKKVLPEIISYNQSAFIMGRLNLDNIIIAYEALHTMKSRQKGREWSMALKLDTTKAYNRIEWSYMRVVMEKIGFAVDG